MRIGSGELEMYSIPVAAVDDEWVEREFLFEIGAALGEQLLHGGLLLLFVDSSEEAEYLLSRFQRATGFDAGSRRISEIQVLEDPYLFVDQALGSEQNTGWLLDIARRSLVLVR